jgi:ParB family chromosome partitioning protein
MPVKKTSRSTGAGAKKKKKMALGKGLDALIPDLGSVEELSGTSPGAQKDYFCVTSI